MSNLKLRKAIASLLLIFVGALTAIGQTTQGTIVGTVRDQQGGVMPNVQVTVTSRSTGLVRTSSTTENGFYRVPGLPAGVYEVRAEGAGFSPAVVEEINLAVHQTLSVDLEMRVAAAAERITVESAVALVQGETSHLGEVIGNKEVLNLPLNGRNFAQLARLNPGISAFGGGGGQQGGEGGVSGFSSNGQRASSNNFMVDGVDNNNYFSGQASQLPSIDSIQEFELQTNTFLAEYGRNTGAVVNLVTRSGTNELYGSVFEFLRNDVLDARNFFEDLSFPKPSLRLNQFGGTLGAPIVKSQTFFFASYEGFRQRAAITQITNVPTLAQRAGIFTDPGGNTVTVQVHPTSAQIVQLYPPPNISSPSGNFISSPKLTNDTDQGLIKIDHRFGDADSGFVRYSRVRSDIFSPFTPG